jgi:hypothetical protein
VLHLRHAVTALVAHAPSFPRHRVHAHQQRGVSAG